MGEEVVGVTRAAERQAAMLRRRVVMDVFGQDAASLQENSVTGSGTFDQGSAALCRVSILSCGTK